MARDSVVFQNAWSVEGQTMWSSASGRPARSELAARIQSSASACFSGEAKRIR